MTETVFYPVCFLHSSLVRVWKGVFKIKPTVYM